MANTASAGEWLNPLDPDSGFSLNQIPLIGGLFDGLCADNENQKNVNAVNSKSWLVNIGGGIGGALLGSYLGKDFGVVGKVGLGVVGAFVAPKLINGIALDAAAATDYVEEGKKKGVERNWFSAFGRNLMDIKGQACTGYSTEEVSADAGPDM